MQYIRVALGVLVGLRLLQLAWCLRKTECVIFPVLALVCLVGAEYLRYMLMSNDTGEVVISLAYAAMFSFYLVSSRKYLYLKSEGGGDNDIVQ